MAKFVKIAALAAIIPAIGACAASGSTRPVSTWSVAATSELRNSSGQQVGIAQLRNRGTEWALAIGISGQTPGEHGIHLHDAGRCEGPDFTSAKGHLNPSAKAHGSANPAGMHAGDLPNLQVGSDGTAQVTLPVPGPVDAATIFDADGTAIVVHAAADDYRSDPAGNSGKRIACGVLIPS